MGIQVDAAARVARAGPGSRWSDYDLATAGHGLASTGGIVSTTGVGELALGVGIGWLMNERGLACDILLGAQVVTADGEIIETSDPYHKDLLWGLRGGGGNLAWSHAWTSASHRSEVQRLPVTEGVEACSYWSLPIARMQGKAVGDGDCGDHRAFARAGEALLSTAPYMSTRTQIYLTERQRARLDEIARREGRSLADLIREAVDDYLDHSDPNIQQALEATFGRVPDLVFPDRQEWERRLG